MTEHDRRILREKNKPTDDREALADFARSHWYCAACGRAGGSLTIHHMIGGRGGRADEPCNLLCLCWDPCHMLAEKLDVKAPREFMLNNGTLAGYWWAVEQCPGGLLPKLTLAIQLSIKLRAGELDAAGLDRLAVLHGRTLPEPAKIPAFFVELFKRNRPELCK